MASCFLNYKNVGRLPLISNTLSLESTLKPSYHGFYFHTYSISITSKVRPTSILAASQN